eukprot:CAMPEP_0119383604 /NCGR_PEP_ID=MMETSP1334-20130426/80684_1 /TAXON_ID=127549 /ORGANISM="Calcidiscus leptoporus, Strain RCC1130" /LENGTH=54 /DNA_ID=CAMNT_0007404451 /DNA_START=122 /DNA_END=282 /DNA_ORIENTATION=+
MGTGVCGMGEAARQSRLQRCALDVMKLMLGWRRAYAPLLQDRTCTRAALAGIYG